MSTERVERRLTAILAADVAGYSRLMGEDEEGTLAQLNGLRRALIDPKIQEHRGRIVKTTGDGLLVEFASVVEATRCAVEMQRGIAESNRPLAAAKRIELRIGIHVGDIIIEGDDIFGDGVNVAARLESIAEPGGICVSGRVREDAEGKLDIAFEDIGERKLKNITRPVRVHRVRLDSTASTYPRRPLIPALAATMLIAVALGAGAWLVSRREQSAVSYVRESSRPAVTTATPIVAVLPFANQAGDQAQEYLADGLTDEVINALGRFNVLRVIGRNPILRFKNRPPTHEEITGDLGANYLVTGTVSRSGKRVRIAAQLTEPRVGTVMWADRYDGELGDIFDFQDNMARQIAGTLAANIVSVESRRSLSQPKPNANAFDLALRARAIGHTATRSANRRFRELIGEAIQLDPSYAAAHALMADALHSQAILGWAEFPDRELSRGAEEARKAVMLAPDQPDGYRALGRILLARGEHDQAQDALKRAIELNPSDANALAPWGAAQAVSGDIAGGIDSLQLALKLDPTLDPNYVFDLAVAYYLAQRYEDALRTVERGLARYPEFAVLNAPAAAAAAQLGRKEQASSYIAELHRRVPMLDLDTLGSRFQTGSHRDALREGLKAAGL